MVKAGQRLRNHDDTHTGSHQLDRVCRGSRALGSALTGHGGPFERIVRRIEHNLVRQIGNGDVVHCAEDVIFRHDHHGHLGVERYGAQIGAIDG